MPTLYCRHIRPSGRRCQSPALRGQPLCYSHTNAAAHHLTLHPPEDGTRNLLKITNGQLESIHREPMIAECYVNTRSPIVLDFPPLEDAHSVQLALSMVLTVLGQGRLDPTRASAMLYNLQIASGNARTLCQIDTKVVRDFVQNESGTLLAPDEDPEEITDHLRFIQELVDARKDDDDEDDEDEDGD